MTRHIKELVNTIFSSQQADWKAQLLKEWDSIVGQINTHVRLEKIYNDSLILSVEDASWMHELSCLAPVLITMINKTLDKPRIKSLRFKQKGITTARSYHTPSHKRYSEPEVPLVLQKKEQAAIDKIKDEQLQEALKRFLMRCKKE